MKKITLFLGLLLVLAISVVAVPPFPDTATGSGITILHPVLESVKVGDTVYLHFHALNSTGFILNTSQYTCGLHLYGDDGNDIYATNSIPTDTLTPNNPYDRLLILNSTIINQTGLYSYNMWCNSTQKESGSLVNYFWITNNGKNPENPNNSYNFIGAIIGITALLIIMLMIYAKLDDKEHWLMKTIIMLLTIYLTLFIPRFIHYNLLDDITFDFLNYYLWFIRIFTIYLFGYFLYYMFNYYGKLDWVKKIIKENFGKK